MKPAKQSPIGIVAHRIAVREFWHDGEIASPCCPIFIEDQDKRCWQLYLDDEDYEWKLHSDIQEFPKFGVIDGGEDMEWKDVKMSNSNHILGKTVNLFSSQINQTTSSAKLSFKNGWMIVATYDFKKETASYEVLEELHI